MNECPQVRLSPYATPFVQCVLFQEASKSFGKFGDELIAEIYRKVSSRRAAALDKVLNPGKNRRVRVAGLGTYGAMETLGAGAMPAKGGLMVRKKKRDAPDADDGQDKGEGGEDEEEDSGSKRPVFRQVCL